MLILISVLRTTLPEHYNLLAGIRKQGAESHPKPCKERYSAKRKFVDLRRACDCRVGEFELK